MLLLELDIKLNYLMPKIYRVFLTLSFVIGLFFTFLWGSLPHHDPAEYFDFSDKRLIFGLPYFGDVISNLAFVIAGLFGLKLMSQRRLQDFMFIKALFWMFGIGLIAVGFGSAYFHWDPTPSTLFWDRLPMAWCFGTILTLLLVDRTNSSSAIPLLLIILILSLLSVIFIDVGLNDLRPYIVLQFGMMLMILLLLVFYKGNRVSDRALFLMLSFYGLAKVFEIYDKQIHQYTIFLSGHNLKHIAAAVASFFLFWGPKQKS